MIKEEEATAAGTRWTHLSLHMYELFLEIIIVLHLNLLLYTFFFRKIFIFVPKQKSFISSLVINLLFEDLLSKKTATVINFDSFLRLWIRNHHLRVQYLHILSMFWVLFFIKKIIKLHTLKRFLLKNKMIYKLQKKN